MDVEIRHLRLLCAVADAGSIAQAARSLQYSQQSVSAQLRRIEQHFGHSLFERTTAGAALTARGAEVVSRSREILARMDVLNHPADLCVDIRGSLRLAATNTPLLAGIASRMKLRFPDVATTIRSVYASSEIVELLEQERLDAAIAADYPGRDLAHSAAMVHRAVATEPTFVALPAGHRLRDRLEVRLADLATESWFLTPDDGAGWPQVFHDACGAAGFAPAAAHEYLGDRRQLRKMISEGLGVSPVQATFRGDDKVIVKPLEGAPLWCRYVLAWRDGGISETTVEALFAAAAGAHRDLVGRSPVFRAWATRTYHSPGV